MRGHTRGAVFLANVLMVAVSYDAMTAPRDTSGLVIRYERIATLDGWPMSWSPSTSELIIQDRRGIWVFDAATPAVPPRHVLATGWSTSVQWSPDGTWLACSMRSPISPVTSETLLVLPATGGHADTVYIGRPLWRRVWGEDGSIYGWPYRQRRRDIKLEPLISLPMPSRWKDQYRGPSIPVFTLIAWPTPPWSIRRFSTSPTPATSTLLGLDALRDMPNIELLDRFPDGERFLVARSGRSFGGRELFIMDYGGNFHRSLGRRIAWNSVSSDGRYLLGTESVVYGDMFLGSKLYVGDVDGAWTFLLDEGLNSSVATFSRRGMFVAYRLADSDSLRFEVARLSIELR